MQALTVVKISSWYFKKEVRSSCTFIDKIWILQGQLKKYMDWTLFCTSKWFFGLPRKVGLHQLVVEIYSSQIKNVLLSPKRFLEQTFLNFVLRYEGGWMKEHKTSCLYFHLIAKSSLWRKLADWPIFSFVMKSLVERLCNLVALYHKLQFAGEQCVWKVSLWKRNWPHRGGVPDKIRVTEFHTILLLLPI